MSKESHEAGWVKNEGWDVPWGILFPFFCFCFLIIQLRAFDYFEDLLRSSYGLRVSEFLDSTRVPLSVAQLLTVVEIWLLGAFIYKVDIGSLTRLVPLKVNRYLILGCLIGGLLAIGITSIRFNIEELKNVQHLLVKDAAFIYLISYVLSYSFIVPLVEEVLFRGLLYSWLRQYTGVIVAILISSTLFALAHGWEIRIVFIFILGVVCALSYERTRSLSFSYWVHASYNFFAPLTVTGLEVLYL